jgi:hypothetical protein
VGDPREQYGLRSSGFAHWAETSRFSPSQWSALSAQTCDGGMLAQLFLIETPRCSLTTRGGLALVAPASLHRR